MTWTLDDWQGGEVRTEHPLLLWHGRGGRYGGFHFYAWCLVSSGGQIIARSVGRHGSSPGFASRPLERT